MSQRRDLISWHAFNQGELSPLLANRQDHARYASGVRLMRNFIPTLQGPVRKRPGFKFVAAAATSATNSWLVPFVFSQTDAWALEFGDATVRFFTDEAQVVEAAKTITGVTQADPGVVTSAAHGFANNDEIAISGVAGMVELNGRSFRVANATANTFTLIDMWGVAVNTAGYAAYGTGGAAARVYQIASPYTHAAHTSSDGLCQLSWAQSGDVLYVCAPGLQQRKLTRSGPTAWAFSSFQAKNGPFDTVDPDQTITVYAGAGTGATTLTASSAIFAATDVGSLFLVEKKLSDANPAWEVGKSFALNAIVRSQGHWYKCTDAGTSGSVTPAHTEGSLYDGADTAANCQWQYQHSGYGWCQITGYVSPTVVNVTVLSTIPDQAVGAGNASTRWAFGSWSDTRGWPTHVAFFRERLWFARGTKIWASVPADFENFAERDAGIVAPDSAFSIDIRSGQNDDILWMSTSADLLVGTGGGEYAVREVSSADPIGPDNVGAFPGPGYGARRVAPAVVNDALIYALPSGRTVRELRFDLATDGYAALNRSAYAEHITKGQVVQMAYAKEPESIVWMCCGNGDLLGLSLEREHELSAWHMHPVAAAAAVESVCAIPTPDGAAVQLWADVRRNINGQVKRYIEVMAQHWDPEDENASVSDQRYAESWLSYAGAPTSVLTNLHHLEGKIVRVLGDGRYLGEFQVTAGGIDISPAIVSTACVGLKYGGRLVSMNIVRPGFLGRIVDAYIRLIATISAQWSTIVWREHSSEGNVNRPVSMGNITVNGAPAPVTALVKAKGESGHGREMNWVIVHEEPTYCCIAGVTPDQLNESGKA